MPTLQEQIAQVLAAQSARLRRPTLGRSILQAPKVTTPPPDARTAVRQAVLGAGRAGLSMLDALGEALDQRPRGVPRDLSTSPGRLLNLPGSILAAGASELADALAGTRTPTTIDPIGTAPQTSFADVGQRLGGLPGALAGMAADVAVPGPGELTTLGKLGTLSPLKAMIAYHGTPHRFPATPENPLGAFDASKIGTGEGAQAYGHGIYLAESPSVAKSYQAAGSDAQYKRVTGGMSPMEEFAFDLASQGRRGEDLFSAMQQRYGKSLQTDQDFDAFDAAIKNAEASVGHLLKADLPDEMVDRMLDWDKPMSEQPDVVKKALAQVAMPQKTVDTMSRNELINTLQYIDPNGAWTDEASLLEFGEVPTIEDLRQAAHNMDVDEYLAMPMAQDANAAGQALYKQLTARAGGGSPWSAEGQKAVSELLRAAGIPGIKYLDAGSRGQGSGTRNFVVFPGEEQKVKILKRE